MVNTLLSQVTHGGSFSFKISLFIDSLLSVIRHLPLVQASAQRQASNSGRRRAGKKLLHIHNHGKEAMYLNTCKKVLKNP
jgi:hypothetical protein